MAHYDIYLTHHTTIGWQLHVQPETDMAVIEFVLRYLQCFEDGLASLASQTEDNSLQSHNNSYEYVNSHKMVSLPTPALPLHHVWHIDDYQHAFAQTQNYLYQGDSYQINLTQKWQGRLGQRSFADNPSKTRPTTLSDDQHQTDPHESMSHCVKLVNYLTALHDQTQAPFAGYLAINPSYGSTDEQSNRLCFELLCCSPELFVQFNKTEDGKQQILTKPIKGTQPRGQSAEQDKQLKCQLANSAKDKAENVMIVDLLRNDLGKYAEIGSVQVPKLFEIESFSNVHHMVSSITAIIKKTHHPLTVLFDSLPAGSITGAPKKRAVEIISELESGPRGAYCGTMGYLNFDGTGQWNVLIRTLQANSQGEVNLWAGGGITVGSECEAEYQECHDKVGNLVRILNNES